MLFFISRDVQEFQMHHNSVPLVNMMSPQGGVLHDAMSEMQAKSVLKEAVDAVVNSFAKHTHGYGRGRSKGLYRYLSI